MCEADQCTTRCNTPAAGTLASGLPIVSPVESAPGSAKEHGAGGTNALDSIASSVGKRDHSVNCHLHIGQKEIDLFRRHGCICLREWLTPEIVHQLRQLSDEMSARASSILANCRRAGISPAARAQTDPRELIVVPEDAAPDQVCRYEFMIGSDPRFSELVASCIQPIVAMLVGEDVVPFKDKTNEKLPGGGAFRPHQDFAAYRAFPPRYHATAVLSIHPATVSNGCLQFATNLEALVATRSNAVLDSVGGKALLHYYEGGANNGDIRADIAAMLGWESLPTSFSDLVVFDSFVPHRSSANHSQAARRAVFVTFTRASEGSFYAKYYADKRINYDHPRFHVSTPTLHRARQAPQL